MDDLRTAGMIDLRIAAAALDVRQECRWFGCSTTDVERTSKALAKVGFTAWVVRGWHGWCPSQGSPQCDLRDGGGSGPPRPDCRYCHGVGYCVGGRPSSVGKLVSVAALGVERVRWAEEVLAPKVAAWAGFDLKRVAWQVIGETAQGRRDPYFDHYTPRYRALRDRWVVPLDTGADGSVVLGVLWIEHAGLMAAAEVTHG